MIHFRYNKLTRSYRTSLDMQKTNKDFVSMKFDTGASDTIVTTGALGLDHIQAEMLLKAVQNRNLEGNVFTSASGNYFTGYPCFCDDLKIGDVLVKRFYYYIVFNDKPKALLGDDFISCCTFSHSFKSDIVVTAFHFGEYGRQRESKAKNNIDVFEILSVDNNTMREKGRGIPAESKQ